MPSPDPTRVIHCTKLDKDLPGLAEPPFPNQLGQYIFENVSYEGWDQWLSESVRIINTYKFELGTKQGNEFMFRQLRIWLGMDDGELAATAWTPPKD